MVDVKNENSKSMWRKAMRKVMKPKTENPTKTENPPEEATPPGTPPSPQDDNVNVNNINVPINIDLSCPEPQPQNYDNSDKVNRLERALEECRKKNGECETKLTEYYQLVSQATKCDKQAGSNNTDFLVQMKESIDRMVEQSKNSPGTGPDSGSERVLEEMRTQFNEMANSLIGEKEKIKEKDIEIKELTERFSEIEKK